MRDSDESSVSRKSEAAEIIEELLLLIEDFMPNIGRCALNNYQRLNEAPIKARRWLEEQRKNA